MTYAETKKHDDRIDHLYDAAYGADAATIEQASTADLMQVAIRILMNDLHGNDWDLDSLDALDGTLSYITCRQTITAMHRQALNALRSWVDEKRDEVALRLKG